MTNEELILQLVRQQGDQIKELGEKVSTLSAAVELLAGRVKSLEDRVSELERTVHSVPCRRLERLEDAVQHIDNWRHESMTISREAKGRFSNLFWAVVTNVAVSAVSVIGTLIALGYRTWIHQ